MSRTGAAAIDRGATLAARDLRVELGGACPVDGVSLDLRGGEVVGLIGPNGAGKTTLLDALAGAVPMAGGSVLLDGRSIGRLAAHDRARLGLGRTFQSVDLFAAMTVGEHLALAGRRRGRRAADTTGAERTARIVELLGLGGAVELLPHQLDVGSRQLVGVARAATVGHRVLALDEPATGLDADGQARLVGLVRWLADHGVGVLLSDHDLELVLTTCDRVHLLHGGRIVASGAPDELRGDPLLRSIYATEDVA